MAKVYVLNPGGVSPVSMNSLKKQFTQKELEHLGGIGLNPRRKKKKKASAAKKKKGSKTVTANRGEKSMAKRRKKASKKRRSVKRSVRRKRKTAKRRKSVKRNVRRTRAKRKTAKRRKSVKRSVRRKRKTAKRRKSVKRNVRRKRKTSRRKMRRNPVAANVPRKRRKSKRSARRNARRLPSMLGFGMTAAPRRRRSKSLGRRVSLNTMLSTIRPNAWAGAPRLHAKAAKLGHRRAGRKVRRNPGYPVMRNQAGIMGKLQVNLKTLLSQAFIVDTMQVSAGSVLSPIVAASAATAIEKGSGGRVSINLNTLTGKALIAASGAAMATGATMVFRGPKVAQNILYGTLGGLVADAMKQYIVPRLTKSSVPAAPAEAAATVTEGTVVSEESPTMQGMSGVRADLAREVSTMGMGAYATQSQVIRATLAEEF